MKLSGVYLALQLAYGLSDAATATPESPTVTPPPNPRRGERQPLNGLAFTCWDDIPTSDAASSYCTASLGTVTPGYAATWVPCGTAATHVRSATALGSGESRWLASRTASANEALRTYLPSAWKEKHQYDLDKIMSTPPRVGLAFSGGGYRAMLTGAGALSVLHENGILNSSLYISGLSGGAWAVGTWALLNFTDPGKLVRYLAAERTVDSD